MKTHMILTMIIAATTATMTAQVATVEMSIQPKVLMRVAAVVKSVKALMTIIVATTATMAAQIAMGIQHNGADESVKAATAASAVRTPNPRNLFSVPLWPPETIVPSLDSSR